MCTVLGMLFAHWSGCYTNDAAPLPLPQETVLLFLMRQYDLGSVFPPSRYREPIRPAEMLQSPHDATTIWDFTFSKQPLTMWLKSVQKVRNVSGIVIQHIIASPTGYSSGRLGCLPCMARARTSGPNMIRHGPLEGNCVEGRRCADYGFNIAIKPRGMPEVTAIQDVRCNTPVAL